MSVTKVVVFSDAESTLDNLLSPYCGYGPNTRWSWYSVTKIPLSNFQICDICAFITESGQLFDAERFFWSGIYVNYEECKLFLQYMLRLYLDYAVSHKLSINIVDCHA